MKQNVNFGIKADLWVKICEEQTSFSGTRLRINNKYANDFLTRIIMDFNLKCELSCGYNWIKVDLSRKIGCPYWRAVFFCKNCKSKFEAKIQKEPNSIENNSIIEIVFDDQNICTEIVNNKNRYSGEKREKLACEIMSKGYTKLKSENVIYNSAFPEKDGKLTFNIF